MACFYYFHYIFQTCSTYYNSVTPEWIKYKAVTVLCHIYIKLLLLWQRRVEVTRACQNFFDLKYQILFIYFNIIISELENVVKLNIAVRWTSNVTCGKFEHCRDSNINVMVFCCEIHWMKSLKKLLMSGFWAEQHVLIKVSIEVRRIPVRTKNDGFIFLLSQCFKSLSL